MLELVKFQMFQQLKNLAMKRLDRFEVTNFVKQVPSLRNLHEKNFFLQDELTPFKGGESEALKRLRESIRDKVYLMYCKESLFNLAHLA